MPDPSTPPPSAPGQPVDPAPRPLPAAVPHAGRWATLEPLSRAHAAALWPAARDAPDSWTWLPAGPFAEAGPFAGYVRMLAASPEGAFWAVRPHGPDGAPGPAAGWLALLDAHPEDAAIELGNIWFPPGLARTRAATEAMALLLGHAADLGYRRLAWKCDSLNLASRRAALRLGFVFEGTLRAHRVVKGLRRDTDWFSILADAEWPARRAALDAWLDPANFDSAGRARASLAPPADPAAG